MSDSQALSLVDVTFDPKPSIELGFSSLTGNEELGQPFLYTLQLFSATSNSDLTAMLGGSATVAFDLMGGGKRYINGIVTRLRYTGQVRAVYGYEIELRPWIWLLTRKQDCHIFQNMSPWNIITQLFRDAGFSNFQDKRQSQSGDTVLEYCVQYNETSFDFVSRLMERYGIYYYFTHTNGQHQLVLADDPNSHTALARSLPYHISGEALNMQEDYVSGWSAELLLQSGSVSFRDYNFTTPSDDLTAKTIKPAQVANYGSLEVYNYPAAYPTAADGTKLSDVAMQGLDAARRVIRARTNARTLLAGTKFTLAKATDTSINKEYLVTGTTTSLRSTQGKSVGLSSVIDSYICEFIAIEGTVTFRTPPRTHWPVMRGPQTAKVVGTSGEEIFTDQYGRVKVSFFWDRQSRQDENSSCWIRVAQSWAHTGWGSIFIPRIGMEVIVDFIEGNPDRPIITGCVYNATPTGPFPLPAKNTRATLNPNSSPGGGGFNELRFEDKKGNEEVFFQAQKDYTKKVLNNETVTIHKDTATTVETGDRSVTVSKGKNSLTVSTGDNATTISAGNDSLTVSQGNHTITVSAGSSTITAGQSITLQVGGNSLVINTEGVTINGIQIGLTASTKLAANGGGMMTLQAGMININ